jgi:alginate O-acetyltransferase complex protein AlgI
VNFATPQFLLFLAIVFVAALASASAKSRKVILLVASYVFYATWNIPFIALILLSTSTDYFLSKRIAVTTDQLRRKILLSAGIALNLTILGVFKYYDFFAHSVNQVAVQLFQHTPILHALNLLLPLGISFYTFEAIGYLIDVYRGEKPAESFYDYNFYIMYFPHLISGPIVRYHELSPQMKNGVTLPNTETLLKGIELIVLGLVFKILVADSVSGLADPIFGNASQANISSIYIAWAAFTTQIYFDFMGYTHIARGVSLLFNIALPINFDHPYNASNISNFWQRWHISLSRWIRDYLFISIGGSRRGKTRMAFNLLVTMAIAGAWHGAGWPFIAWGIYHGVLLLGYHISEPVRNWNVVWKESVFYKYASTIFTFILVAYGWIWFRSSDLSMALVFSAKIFRLQTLFREVTTNVVHGDYIFLATMALLLALCTSGPFVVDKCNKLNLTLPRWVKVPLATVAMVSCFIFAGTETKPFIYFQF